MVKEKVPRVWVHGVITQLNVRGRMCYIGLGGFDEESTSPKAILPVYMWSSQLDAINLKLSGLPTPFELKVELKVCFLLQAQFYVPSGKFQPRVVEMDENFTLGELAQARQRILQALIKDGLLEKNKSLALSCIPLKVGLITAPGSAAYKDFTSVLLSSGFAFDIHFCPAKMQGRQTETTVFTALHCLYKLNLDVIVLIRGGGGKTDLVYFDSEKICRAIAASPVPVITGIGHEIDNSLSDLVAFAQKITPTDCAKFLENRILECWNDLCEKQRFLNETCENEIKQSRRFILMQAKGLTAIWKGREEGERIRIVSLSNHLKKLTRKKIIVEEQFLSREFKGLRRGPQKLWRNEILHIKSLSTEVRWRWKSISQNRIMKINQSYLTLKSIAPLVIKRQGKSLSGVWKSVNFRWKSRVQNLGEKLEWKDRAIRASDPVAWMRKGFALVHKNSGKLVTSSKELREGENLKIHWIDGDAWVKTLERNDQNEQG